MSKGFKLFIRSILIILLFTVLLFGYKIAKVVIGYSSTSEKNEFQGEDLASGNKILQKNPDELLFLFAGVDSTGDKVGTRTDTLMLVLANKVNKTINIISIPRDTLVYIDGEEDKINAAHSYGGMAMTIKTLRDFFGIDLDYFTEVSFQAVVDAVDAMGGVNIDVDEYTADAMEMNPGLHTFNGKEALDYVRFRKGYANADLGRIQTQQDFMVQLIKQMLEAKNILKLPEVFASTGKNIDTNIPLSTMLSFAWSFKNISEADINTYMIDGYADMIDGVSYYIADEDSVSDIRNSILFNYIYWWFW